MSGRDVMVVHRWMDSNKQTSSSSGMIAGRAEEGKILGTSLPVGLINVNSTSLMRMPRQYCCSPGDGPDSVASYERVHVWHNIQRHPTRSLTSSIDPSSIFPCSETKEAPDHCSAPLSSSFTPFGGLIWRRGFRRCYIQAPANCCSCRDLVLRTNKIYAKRSIMQKERE